MSTNPLSRRDFLRHAACAAVGTTALASTVWNLRAINAATIANSDVIAANDYKALVCLYLYGGNDANNLLIPTDTAGYNAYASARQGLALPLGGATPLLALNPPTTYSDGHTYGLHPRVPGLQNLYNTGKLAFVCNAGTLIHPVTRADWLNGVPKFPPQLFSHNDQQVQWQTSIPDQVARTGWGGRLADLMMAEAANPEAAISLSLSLAGTNTYQIGNNVFQYQVSPYGVVDLAGYSGNTKIAVDNILNVPHQNLFETEFARITKRALANNADLKTALAGVNLTTPFPTYADYQPRGLSTYLADQLKMVARLIAARAALKQNRQMFFVAVGGYDTHGDQLGAHTNLLIELSEALSAFYQATVDLGVASRVTTFTASDFGRTFPVNGGAGSDHGWGSHHLVLGGAVKGKDLYGRYPTLTVNGPDDTGEGRWIPTVSVDEYSATLAKWFGADANGLNTVFPNLGRFARPDLGFMNFN